MNNTAVKQKPQKDSVDVRFAKVETTLPFLATKAELKEEIANVRADIANVRTELKQDISNVKTELKQDMHKLEQRLNARSEKDFRMLCGALIGVALGLAGLMAKGFHWL